MVLYELDTRLTEAAREDLVEAERLVEAARRGETASQARQEADSPRQ